MAAQVNTRHEMRRAGYVFKSTSHCKACNAPIEWWKTTKGRNMPFNPIANDHEQTVMHWAICPESDGFRGSDEPKPADPLKLLSAEAGLLCERFGLRAVVLLDDRGMASCFRFGIPPEDLRNEIISAANKVREDAMTYKGGR